MNSRRKVSSKEQASKEQAQRTAKANATRARNKESARLSLAASKMAKEESENIASSRRRAKDSNTLIYIYFDPHLDDGGTYDQREKVRALGIRGLTADLTPKQIIKLLQKHLPMDVTVRYNDYENNYGKTSGDYYSIEYSDKKRIGTLRLPSLVHYRGGGFINPEKVSRFGMQDVLTLAGVDRTAATSLAAKYTGPKKFGGSQRRRSRSRSPKTSPRRRR